MDRCFRRGEIAKILGIPSPTVKFYTTQGLFSVKKRTPYGQYLYDLEEIRRMYFLIKELKDKRLTIEEIKTQLKDQLHPNRAEPKLMRPDWKGLS